MINPMDIDVVLEQVRDALTKEDWKQAVALVEALRPPDQADVFEELPPETQDLLLPRLNPEDSADILEELTDEDAAEVAARLEPSELARILNKMEPDEVADLLGDIAPDQVAHALSALEDAEEIRPLLEHQDDTAGGLMTSIDLLLHKDITAAEALDHLRRAAPDSETVYYLYVVDNDMHLVGVVSLRQLVVAPTTTRIADLMDTVLILLTYIPLGMFLDPVSMFLITIPFFFPAIVSLGFHPVWFGVMVTMNCEMAHISPPVGLNLFILKGICPDDISMIDIIKGCAPFMAVIGIAIGLVIAFPELILWLPGTMS